MVGDHFYFFSGLCFASYDLFNNTSHIYILQLLPSCWGHSLYHLVLLMPVPNSMQTFFVVSCIYQCSSSIQIPLAVWLTVLARMSTLWIVSCLGHSGLGLCAFSRYVNVSCEYKSMLFVPVAFNLPGTLHICMQHPWS